MDLATLIGMLGAFAFIVMAMLLGGSLGMFFDVPSVLIVFGGTTFVVLMKYSIGQFLGATKIAAKAFMYKTDNPEELIAKIVEMADAARKGGFLALEEMEIDNPFLRKGIDLLVDGHDADVVRATLQKDISLTHERHEQGIGIFTSFGDVGPAMGMIGTLIGLVAMLSNMDDPKSIGPAMAVALLTTLYGSILANMVALPIADKLSLRKDQERLNRRLILDGVLAIQDGQNPRVIDGYLKNYLHEKKRVTAMDL
ncbi:flagellar motor protein PomA [Photobacterium damselae]|uniref:Flagellar motor rotation protein MotA n=4 Tax=Photobacterium damselae TaxID=38293 RepID=D0YZF8_PHODD|nr:flagellar motor protein PomA [Photobacterium damselae]AWK82532.1 flagellar motor protein PomA [Photobacterium damselae]EEZ41639.1 Flagellar motor rotation protein MotA [Photobacterium damselae subsp. damselae CIP 102761]EJN6960134.1 flagellar motor protein PomA [Photobacterium damselae]KAB1178956.1 flagellar motor protein PomA [Photobacterium damselae subsp. damselae]KAB1179814.1 flagellar motor protein PomA [Photobacterium damselae subsp. damselae]